MKKRFLFLPTTTLDIEELAQKAKRANLTLPNILDFADNYTSHAEKIGILLEAENHEKNSFVAALIEASQEGHLYELPAKIDTVEDAALYIEQNEIEHSEYI